MYELYAVLIHSGSALGGHYYAYIKNLSDGKWYDVGVFYARPRALYATHTPRSTLNTHNISHVAPNPASAAVTRIV